MLEFFASPDQQIEWQSQVPGADSTEFMCWWLDDFYPDSPLFAVAFTPSEIAMLVEFNKRFEHATERYPGPGPSSETLLKDPEWLGVVAHAKRLIGELPVAKP